MSLESSRTLGGTGAILIAIGSFFPISSIVGIIFVLIAMKNLADCYNENGIFENTFYGSIFGIIGTVAAAAVAFSGGIFTCALSSIFVSFTLPKALIVAIVVFLVFSLLQVICYKKSFDILSGKSSEKIFDNAGLLLLIGAILTIILIGLVLSLVAWMLIAVGFFSIKTTGVTKPAHAPQKAHRVSGQKKYCPYCGIGNKDDASFLKVNLKSVFCIR